MSKIFFVSDHHFGHKNILKFCKETRNNCDTVDEHDEWLIEQHNSIIKKRDIVYFLGDVTFSETTGFNNIKRMNGQKILLMGNHDKFPLELYQDAFYAIRPPMMTYKGFLLSHAPIHPQELRYTRKNVHGHVHQNSIPDDRYINVSVDVINGIPISLEEIRER